MRKALASPAPAPPDPSDETRLTQEWMEGVATGPGRPPSRLPPEAAPAAADPSRRCGQYLLATPLGQGAMGEVWKAWDTQLQRWAAVKILKYRRPAAIQRFINEARAMARISHPNLVAVYGTGRFREQPYIAMQLAAGTSLGAGGLDLRRAAEVVRDAARGLHEAHRLGIIHRDVKPDNILLDAAGRVLVTDFGLAHFDEDSGDGPSTGAHAILGTPAFMSPEQAQGFNAQLTPASDVYGLGATLYFLVTGRYACEGRATPELLNSVIAGRVLPPRSVNPSLPPDLEAVILRAMAREAADRYGSAEELAADLDRYLADEPVRARPPKAPERSVRWIRKHRRPAAIGAAAGLVLVAALAAVLVAQESRRGARSRAQAALAPALLALDQAERGAARLAEARAGVEACFAESTRLDPSFGPAYLVKARLLHLSGKPREAEALLDPALEDPETRADAYFHRALFRVSRYSNRRRLPRAYTVSSGIEYYYPRYQDGPGERELRAAIQADLEAYAAAIPGGRNDPRSRYARALLLLSGGGEAASYQEAATEMQPAIDAFRVPQAEGFHQQGLAYLWAGRLDKALGSLRKARAAGKNTAGFWFYLASILHLQVSIEAARGADPGESIQEALLCLDRAKEAGAEFPELGGIRSALLLEKLQFRLAREALRPGDVDEAVRVAREAAERGREPWCLSRLAIALEFRGRLAGDSGLDPEPDYREAIDLLGRVLQADPEDRFALGNRAIALNAIAQRQLDAGADPTPTIRRSLDDLGKALEQDPRRRDLWSVRGVAHRMAGQHLEKSGADGTESFAAGARDFREALRLGESAEAWNNLGNLHFTQGALRLSRSMECRPAFEEALRAFRRATELDDRLDTPWLNLGLTHFKLGRHLKLAGGDSAPQFRQAISHFTQAIARRPGLADAHVQRALSHYQVGEYRKAREGLLKAVELSPALKATWGPTLADLEKMERGQPE